MSIGDRVVDDVAPKDRDIAMVVQDHVLYPLMSVYDNIGFALELAEILKAEIASLQLRETVPIVVTTEQMHFFDIETRLAIGS